MCRCALAASVGGNNRRRCPSVHACRPQMERPNGYMSMLALVVLVVSGLSAVEAGSAGDKYSCAVFFDGSVKCWGSNSKGQLGQNDSTNRGKTAESMGDDLPSVDLGETFSAVTVASGNAFNCAISTEGFVKCWGSNNVGQLGLGDNETRGAASADFVMGDDLPFVQVGGGNTVSYIGLGVLHACVVLTNQSLKCWGDNESGQLGYGDNKNRGALVTDMGEALAVVNLGTNFTVSAVALGEKHTCALSEDGGVKCWGSNTSGQLGYGDDKTRGVGSNEMGDNLLEVDLGSGRRAVSIALGNHHSCSLLDTGDVKCWGFNRRGQLGQGSTDNVGGSPNTMGDALLPITLGTSRTAVAIAAGGLHTCAVLDDDTIKCWGKNEHGTLGTGDNTTRGDEPGEMGDNLLPITLTFGDGGGKVANVFAGVWHTCVSGTVGGLACFGRNNDGQLGAGTNETIGDDAGETEAISSIDFGATGTLACTEYSGADSCSRTTPVTIAPTPTPTPPEVSIAPTPTPTPPEVSIKPLTITPPSTSSTTTTTPPPTAQQTTQHTAQQTEPPTELPAAKYNTDVVNSEEKGGQAGIMAGIAAAGTLIVLTAIGLGWFGHKQKMKRNIEQQTKAHDGNDSPANALKAAFVNVVDLHSGRWVDPEAPTGGNDSSPISADALGTVGGISPNEGSQLPSENRSADLQDTASTCFADMDDLAGTEMSSQVFGVPEEPTSPSTEGGGSNDLVPGCSSIGTSEVFLAKLDTAAPCNSATPSIPTEQDAGLLTTIGEVGGLAIGAHHENDADGRAFVGERVALSSATDNGAVETRENLVQIAGTQTYVDPDYSVDQDTDDAHDGRCSHDMPCPPQMGQCSELAVGSNNFGSAQHRSCNDLRPSSGGGVRASPTGLQVARAVMEAAHDIAQRSGIPGVSEAATLVAVLVKLTADRQNNAGVIELRTRWCRSILLMLERAGVILGESDKEHEESDRILIEDVRDAVADLVQLMQTYSTKNRISKLLTSSLFQRRQDEADAAVNLALSRLQLGLQVQVGQNISAVGQALNAIGQNVEDDLFLRKRFSEDAATNANIESIVESRRVRRQRRLDQIEIPMNQLTITEDVLGRGGFGTVYLADYNGRNAAAKILLVDIDLGAIDDDDLDERERAERMEKNENIQRRSFMRELEAMYRLRSPHTVHVYGAITTLKHQFVLVMELLPGGDLCTLLKKAKEPLSAPHARQIIGDICAGVTFLHSRSTIHGDLKAANVLFDLAGRAKISDFGTSRWKQHTMSTGFATYSTQPGQHGRMSLPWAAPEVLTIGATSYASDVYSFGIVVWEVLSREIPWAAASSIQDLYRLVYYQEARPEMPADAPADLADIARACWTTPAKTRPSCAQIMRGMKANGWGA